MKVLKILGIMLLVIVGAVVVLLLLNWWNSIKPLYAEDYYKKLETAAPLEDKYVRKGSHKRMSVSYVDEAHRAIHLTIDGCSVTVTCAKQDIATIEKSRLQE